MCKPWTWAQVKIGDGFDSRNLRPMAKSDVGNPTTNLGTISENKDLMPGSGNVWTSQNYSGGSA